MNDLGEVLGGLLRSLATARFVSDSASRQLSLLYEKDELLRLFPVPRMDYREVQADIGFAVRQVEAAPADAEIQVDRLIDQTVEKIMAAVAKALDASVESRTARRILTARKEVADILDRLVREVRAQPASSAAGSILVDVAAPDVAKVPPEILSRVKLSVGVQNYEWVEVDEKNGEKVHKLAPSG